MTRLWKAMKRWKWLTVLLAVPKVGPVLAFSVLVGGGSLSSVLDVGDFLRELTKNQTAVITSVLGPAAVWFYIYIKECFERRNRHEDFVGRGDGAPRPKRFPSHWWRKGGVRA